MEKKVLQYCYWLGVLCLVVALVWRAVDATGYLSQPVRILSLAHMTFYKGAVLFLLAALATGSYLARNQP